MKRMKKMYSITGLTDAIIKRLAEEINMPESYALDNMTLNYWRMTHKGKDMPIPTEIKVNVKKGLTDEEWIAYDKAVKSGEISIDVNPKEWVKEYREKNRTSK